jgi:hypothetical protein
VAGLDPPARRVRPRVTLLAGHGTDLTTASRPVLDHVNIRVHEPELHAAVPNSAEAQVGRECVPAYTVNEDAVKAREAADRRTPVRAPEREADERLYGIRSYALASTGRAVVSSNGVVAHSPPRNSSPRQQGHSIPRHADHLSRPALAIPTGCRSRWKHLDVTGTVGSKEGAVEIGEPERTYTVEPLEDPVPREPSQPPEEAPEQEPLEPERVDAA